MRTSRDSQSNDPDSPQNNQNSNAKRKAWEMNVSETIMDVMDPKSDAGSGSAPVNKRARRHAWQPKYEADFGLIAIERHSVSNEVVLAMCGFCKAFGREGKYQQSMQDSDLAATDTTKKRRRRSLTTTKFFRAFRVDNIRSHMLGAHPRRWAEYELLPKQDSIRLRYFDCGQDSIGMMNHTMLSAGMIKPETDMTYEHPQLNAYEAVIQSHPEHQDSQRQASIKDDSSLNLNCKQEEASFSALHPSEQPNEAAFSDATALAAALVVQNAAAGQQGATNSTKPSFDYEQHLLDRIALDRERLDFENSKSEIEANLRDRESNSAQQMLERKSQMDIEKFQVEKIMKHDEHVTQGSNIEATVREAIASTCGTCPAEL